MNTETYTCQMCGNTVEITRQPTHIDKECTGSMPANAVVLMTCCNQQVDNGMAARQHTCLTPPVLMTRINLALSGYRMDAAERLNNDSQDTREYWQQIVKDLDQYMGDMIQSMSIWDAMHESDNDSE